jgi:hypothetical protein
MRITDTLAVASLCAACASSASPVAVGPPSVATPPVATAPRPAATTPPAPTRNHTLDVDELPPAFAQLSPRDRERWHACHIFFLVDRRTGAPTERYDPTPGSVYRPPAQQHLGFSVTPAQYVAVAEADRRAFLIAHGCPDSLVDLADGTHLDLVEH